jgi:hypothetical protein
MGSFLEILRWTIGSALLGVGVLIALANWIIIFKRLLCGRYESVIPLLGGFVAALGLVVSPLELGNLWWLPLIADPGCVLSPVSFLVLIFLSVSGRIRRRN